MHYARRKAHGATQTRREHFLRTHPSRGGIGLVPLHGGGVAMVDAADYPRVIRHRWYTNSTDGREFPTTVIDDRQVPLSHFVLGIERGKVLLRDKDALNCRRGNLRVATQQQLSFNQRVQRRRTKSSRYKGVSRRKDTGRYEAYITRDGRRTRLGCFDTEREAALAYDDKARELFGPFARLNLPGESA